MMQKADGMNYAPKGKVKPICKKGEFLVGIIGLDHGHIHGMCNGLTEAGAELVSVYDSDPGKVEAFCKTYPGVKQVLSEQEILNDSRIHLIASAIIPSLRCALGLRSMQSGKDFFVDKAPFTTMEHLDSAKKAVKETGKKYMVYYSERLHVESAVLAGNLIKENAIGRVLQIIGLGPHRLNASSRPPWFFQKDYYGGILCDIGSHQIEQFLSFSGAKHAEITSARVANYHHKEYSEFEDFGEATLVADNGAVNYFRVDWFTPDGLGVWGDGRAFILGTDGYIELRKYIDIARSPKGDQVYLVNHKGEKHIHAAGTVGFPFFGSLILDCLNRTENAMTQEHAFKAAELCLRAQAQASKIE